MPSTASASRNRFATFPDTPSARRNLTRLLRETTTVSYTQVARVTVHDKSWVSRFLAGNGLISLGELLAWLDLCELMLAKDVAGTDPIGEDQALLARLEAALGALDTLKSNTLEACRCERACECECECELMLSLIGLARVGLEHLLQRYRSAPGM